MARVDQKVRLSQGRAWIAGKRPSRTLIANERATTRAHAKSLRKIIDQVGWPPLSVFGEEAARDAFILVLHDPSLAFQKRCLSLMKRGFRRGQVGVFHLAYLWDRILIRQKRKQSLGTHLIRLGEAEWGVLPVRAANRLDQRRARFGLTPLEDYVTANERRWAEVERSLRT